MFDRTILLTTVLTPADPLLAVPVTVNQDTIITQRPAAAGSLTQRQTTHVMHLLFPLASQNLWCPVPCGALQTRCLWSGNELLGPGVLTAARSFWRKLFPKSQRHPRLLRIALCGSAHGATKETEQNLELEADHSSLDAF